METHVDVERVTVAAVQATPVFLDREATVDKAVDLIAKSAANGAGGCMWSA